MNPARTDDTPVHHRTPIAQRAAWLFSALIRAELTEDELADVLAMNARETDPGVCHTHDFIDSNVTMAAALDAVGVEASVHRDDASAKAYTALWNEAWNLAKASGFATSAREDALRNALRWALEQIEDSLDSDHQAALAEARKALSE
jgi:hypothetical protein